MREEIRRPAVLPDEDDPRAARRALLLNRADSLLATLVLPLALLLWKIRIWVVASPGIFSGLSLLLVLGLLLAGLARLRGLVRLALRQAGPWTAHMAGRGTSWLVAVLAGTTDPPLPQGSTMRYPPLPTIYTGLALAGPAIR